MAKTDAIDLSELEKAISKIDSKLSKLKKVLNGKSATTSINVNVQQPVPGFDIVENKLARFVQAIERLDFSFLTDTLEQAVTQSLIDNDLEVTGKLRGSISIIVRDGGLIIQYDSPYAWLLHEGGYILPYGNPKAAPVYIAPRPWISEAMEKINFYGLLEARLLEIYNSV
jgi:hypothetical protein